jgi:hypothetical protein
MFFSSLSASSAVSFFSSLLYPCLSAAYPLFNHFFFILFICVICCLSLFSLHRRYRPVILRLANLLSVLYSVVSEENCIGDAMVLAVQG